MGDQMAFQADPDCTTCLAAYLNAAMARSSEARAAYARTYGCEWAPLGNGCQIADDTRTNARTVR